MTIGARDVGSPRKDLEQISTFMEVVVMEASLVRFTGSTSLVEEILTFGCKVEYSNNLDPFLPKDLEKQTRHDGGKTTISPLGNGVGSISASSLERAEQLEAEIKAKLQTAYEGLIEWQKRIDQWTAAREYVLTSSDGNREEAMAAAPALISGDNDSD